MITYQKAFRSCSPNKGWETMNQSILIRQLVLVQSQEKTKLDSTFETNETKSIIIFNFILVL